MNRPQNNWKTIGILGGMGPEATADMYRRIIEICQMNYGAKYDSDYPTIVIYNLPLPDVVENEMGEDIGKFAENGINMLKSAGCDFVSIPCNTVSSIINSLSIPTINIIEEAYFEANKRVLKKVGLLATRNTYKNRLYENVFDKKIQVIKPSDTEQEKVNEIVVRILAGFKTTDDRAYLKTLIRKLEKQGAEAVILGCTELPLLISQNDCDIEILDTLQILSESAVKKARCEA